MIRRTRPRGLGLRAAGRQDGKEITATRQLAPTGGDAGGCQVISTARATDGTGVETYDMTIRYGGSVTCPDNKQPEMADELDVTVTSADGKVVFRGSAKSPVSSDPQRQWRVQMSGVDGQGQSWSLKQTALQNLDQAQTVERALAGVVDDGASSFYVDGVSNPAP